MKDLDTVDVLQILGPVLVVFGIIFIAIGTGRLISYTLFIAGAVLPIVSWVIRRKRR